MPGERVLRYPTQTSGAKSRLFLLIGVFLILAPASVSGDATGDGTSYLKWARVVLLAVVTLMGLRWLRWPRPGDVSARLLALAGIFCIGAVWSTSPVWGLAFKGMFVASVVAGISLANALRSEGDFRTFARIMTATTVTAAGIVIWIAFTQTEPALVKGRLVVGDLNPNLLAQSAAVFALLCVFHLLVRDAPRWVMAATLGAAAMLVLTVLSGSRGAALMLVAGLTVLLPVLGRNRRHVVTLAAVSITVLAMVGTYWFFQEDPTAEYYGSSVDEESAELRIFRELTKDTRMKVWRDVTRKWLQHPVIGHGWLHRANRWSTVQSAYLQVLVETGLIGFTALIYFLISALARIRQALMLARRSLGLPSQLCYVFAATLFALLFHAAFESSAVTGTSPNAVFLGFCVAQLDRLTRLIQQQRRAARTASAEPSGPASAALLDLAGVSR